MYNFLKGSIHSIWMAQAWNVEHFILFFFFKEEERETLVAEGKHEKYIWVLNPKLCHSHLKFMTFFFAQKCRECFHYVMGGWVVFPRIKRQYKDKIYKPKKSKRIITKIVLFSLIAIIAQCSRHFSYVWGIWILFHTIPLHPYSSMVSILIWTICSKFWTLI